MGALPNCQTNLVISLHTLSLLFCKFIKTTAYHLGRYQPSSPVSCHAPQLEYHLTIIKRFAHDTIPMLSSPYVQAAKLFS